MSLRQLEKYEDALQIRQQCYVNVKLLEKRETETHKCIQTW